MPQFFSDDEFRTLVLLADALMHREIRWIEPEAVAERADDFVYRIDYAEKDLLKKALWSLNKVAARFMWPFGRTFRELSFEERRQVIDSLAEIALLRPLVRTLKLLVVFPYYTHEDVRREIGFVPFEERKRAENLDKTPLSHPDPNPPSADADPQLPTRSDVVIVGSGAGGALVAYELARAGLRVLVLERGAREEPCNFTQNEFDMIPRLYKQGGLQTTADNKISLLQGATVGGSTVINNAIWLRPDLPRILDDWEERTGHVDRAKLVAAYEHVENLLHVRQISANMSNNPTKLFLEGSRRRGIAAEHLDHNRVTCIGCGWCNYGCKYDRKTSALVTLIPWAEGHGATVLDRCHGVRLEQSGDRVTHVTFSRDGSLCRVAADRVVVAAGAIGSSELLIQSGLDDDAERVGSGFHALAGCTVTARFECALDGFDKIGLTSVAHASDDFVLESFFSPPGAFAVSLGGWYETHGNRMQNYAHFAQAGVMVAPEPDGRITVRDSATKIHLEFGDLEVERLKRGIRTLTEIFFAAGASEVYPSTFRDMEFHSPDDARVKLRAVRKPSDLVLGSAHPQGGNALADDPDWGPVRIDFRLRGVENVYVADASLFPSNIWANCQATVMALAKLAADSLIAGAQ